MTGGWRGALAIALLAGVGPASATTCQVTATPLAFGLYDTVSATPQDTTATVQVSCTPGLGQPLTTAYVITVAGTGQAGDTVRTLSFGSHRLRYQLYTDVQRSVVWGDGVVAPGLSGQVTSQAALVPGLQNHPAYGRMPAQQQVPAGAYLGSVLITVDY